MIEGPFHIVCSVGDPNDAATWSGTPKALLDGFRQRIPSLQVHDVTLSRGPRKMYQLANWLSGLGARYASKAGIWQRRQADAATKAVARLGPGTFFHIGSDHLPLGRVEAGQRHFYFTDNILDILIHDSPFGGQVTPRFAKATLSREAALMGQVDGVFATAVYVRDKVMATYGLGPDKVVAVGTGVGRVKGLEGAAKDYRNGRILFVAKRNFKGKGGFLLLDAFDLALQEDPGLRLVVIGNDDDPQAAGALERMKSHPSIEYHNWDTPEYQQIVRSAALYAGPAMDEPWGIIYLESLMCETPILGLSRNAFPEFAHGGDYGFIAPDASPETVARTMLKALSSPERLKTMGQAGREYVINTYTWENAVQTMLEAMAR